jgi:hypothetical protein
MLINGINLEGLAHEASSIEIPEQVKGRTVHIDADFLAYQVTAEKANGTDEKTFDEMQHNAEVAVQTLRDLAAAEFVHLHLTPSTSDKGGRFRIALQKEYQGNRVDKPKPRYLGIMREWLAKRYTGTLHQFCEADDGMSSSQYKAIADGNHNLSIIASKDKDLAMVPGLHLDWDSGAIVDCPDPFGHVYLDASKSTKKIKGFGWKFFWAQMLVGDTADNIQGLPAVPARWMNLLKPTAEIKKAQEIVWGPNANEAQKAKAQAVLDARKPGPCGPATAIMILDKLPHNAAAFETVRDLYREHGEKVGFKHYQTGVDIHWGHVFASEAKLLWMRREARNENCVLNWLKENT